MSEAVSADEFGEVREIKPFSLSFDNSETGVMDFRPKPVMDDPKESVDAPSVVLKSASDEPETVIMSPENPPEAEEVQPEIPEPTDDDLPEGLRPPKVKKLS